MSIEREDFAHKGASGKRTSPANQLIIIPQMGPPRRAADAGQKKTRLGRQDWWIQMGRLQQSWLNKLSFESTWRNGRFANTRQVRLGEHNIIRTDSGCHHFLNIFQHTSHNSELESDNICTRLMVPSLFCLVYPRILSSYTLIHAGLGDSPQAERNTTNYSLKITLFDILHFNIELSGITFFELTKI